MKQLIILIFIIATPFTILAQLKGKVVSVIDGDTIILLDSINSQHRIRLHGIDCPERGQDFYQAAKDYLGKLCFKKNVEIEVLGKDKYQRTIGKIWLDSTDLNLEMLKAGMAFHYKHFDKSIHYADAEESAQKHKIGLWSIPSIQEPWQYRSKK